MYAALLRGINVGGKKQVNMESLRKMFLGLGFRDVKAYINSGNVLFESSEKDLAMLSKKIKSKLKSVFGYEIEVFVIDIMDLEGMIVSNPFKNAKKGEVMYVTFLSYGFKKPKLPACSKNKDVEIFLIKDGVAFSVSRIVEGKFGFSNGLAEQIFGVPATTRNWNTIRKIVELSASLKPKIL